MQREELLERYRHLRSIGMHHQTTALGCLARPAILERAKHLGLAYRQTLTADGSFWIRSDDPVQVADDPRWPAAIYRQAIDDGNLEGVAYKDVVMAA